MGLREYAEQHTQPVTAQEQPQEPQPVLLARRQEQEQAAAGRASDVYRAYQAAILQTEQLQTEILRGLQEGENIAALLLKAMKALSLLTSNSALYQQTENAIKSIYAFGLEDTAALAVALEDAEDQLHRLEAAEQAAPDDTTATRIRAAVQAHKKHIEALRDRQGR